MQIIYPSHGVAYNQYLGRSVRYMYPSRIQTEAKLISEDVFFSYDDCIKIIV
jgi:hypothetical protein